MLRPYYNDFYFYKQGAATFSRGGFLNALH